MPKITVKFFGYVGTKVGQRSLQIDVSEDLTQALTEIDRYLGMNLSADLDNLWTLLINGRNYRLLDNSLQDNDNLAFITLAGGG